MNDIILNIVCAAVLIAAIVTMWKIAYWANED